ncbi:CPBP family intramembrane glutamic endopeptidase [Clostridium beijerinckii]|uniref:CPBP family intramembrane metalloprotease n=1 Tax=Clostridium beijerinckii TaxID=1520 RepID=A0A7X9STJ9_CLOBE|nr:CPBP family intramembrane glutamic endopeptidase [Clostridium beijerinckii]NMF07830.1 CPBP family intramembrane metalloprotease [Clostridium beijerinckii]
MNTELQENIENGFTTKKAILAIILGIISVILLKEVSRIVYRFRLPDTISPILFSVLYIGMSYIFIRVCCTKILHISMNECFIGKPRAKITWLIIALLLPVIVSGVLLCFPGELIKNNITTFQSVNVVMRAIFSAGLGAGIVEEMFFRGMIMKALDKRFGKVTAIILPSFIFALMHLIGIKINIVSILLLIVAGTSVGIMFSLIVYESGSIWCSAIVHGIWNIIMIGGILTIGSSYHDKPIYYYKLASESVILTGGEFGIESSIVSILGFLVVSALTLYLMKRKVKNCNNEIDAFEETTT